VNFNSTALKTVKSAEAVTQLTRDKDTPGKRGREGIASRLPSCVAGKKIDVCDSLMESVVGRATKVNSPGRSKNIGEISKRLRGAKGAQVNVTTRSVMLLATQLGIKTIIRFTIPFATTLSELMKIPFTIYGRLMTDFTVQCRDLATILEITREKLPETTW
jgi:hypothetical protein